MLDEPSVTTVRPLNSFHPSLEVKVSLLPFTPTPRGLDTEESRPLALYLQSADSSPRLFVSSSILANEVIQKTCLARKAGLRIARVSLLPAEPGGMIRSARSRRANEATRRTTRYTGRHSTGPRRFEFAGRKEGRGGGEPAEKEAKQAKRKGRRRRERNAGRVTRGRRARRGRRGTERSAEHEGG